MQSSLQGGQKVKAKLFSKEMKLLFSFTHTHTHTLIIKILLPISESKITNKQNEIDLVVW